MASNPSAPNSTAAAPTESPTAAADAGATPAPGATTATPAQAKAVANEIRKLKLKIDGNEMELPESEVIRLAALGGGAQRKFQEAAAMKRQVEQLLKSNPEMVLKQGGTDPRKWAEEYLLQLITRENESPEQKRFREQADKLRAYEEKEKQREDAARKQKEAELQERWASHYDKVITEALSATGIPKSPRVVQRMAQYLRLNEKRGGDVSASRIAEMVREDLAGEYKEHLTGYRTEKGDIDGGKLIEALGPDALKAIKRALVSGLKSKPQTFAKPSSAPARSPSEKSDGMTWRQLRRKASAPKIG